LLIFKLKPLPALAGGGFSTTSYAFTETLNKTVFRPCTIYRVDFIAFVDFQIKTVVSLCVGSGFSIYGDTG